MNVESQRGNGHKGGAPRKRGTALLVVSLNLRHGLAWDGLHCWPLRRRATVRCLADLGAEVVGLQEVHGFQQRYLAHRLSGYAAVGAGRDDGRERGERCTVLYRPGRLELVSWTVRWFSDTPSVPGSRGWGNPVTRLVTLCRFRDRAGGHEFGVADTHWDGASAASRLRSADALLGWLDPALPWIVLGDLNATPGDPAVARLLAGGLQDPLAHRGERGPGAGTHHHWDGATDGTRIDYVLASPERSFTSRHHHLDLEWLAEAYRCLNPKSAPGLDGVTVEAYGKDLRSNLELLRMRVLEGTDRAASVRRVRIPKGTGSNETRPIGIPTLTSYCTFYDRLWGC